MSDTLIREIRNVALITASFSAVQIIIALIAGFGTAAVFGTLLGWFLANFNFSLMGIILEKCISSGRRGAGGLTGVGYILRLAIIAAAVVWAMKVSYLNYVCVIIPLIFPQFAIFIINALRRRKGTDEQSDEGDANET